MATWKRWSSSPHREIFDWTRKLSGRSVWGHRFSTPPRTWSARAERSRSDRGGSSSRCARSFRAVTTGPRALGAGELPPPSSNLINTASMKDRDDTNFRFNDSIDDSEITHAELPVAFQGMPQWQTETDGVKEQFFLDGFSNPNN